jgi:hypothetical protein
MAVGFWARISSSAFDTFLSPKVLGPSEDYGNEEHTTVAAFLPWRGS